MRLALVALVLTTMVACRAANSGDCTQKDTEDCMSTPQVTHEEAKRAMIRHDDLIRRQPNYTGSVADATPTDDGEEVMGITVFVSEIVDQETLPEEDRIGDCLDGVPVRFEVMGPFRFGMGLPNAENDYDDPDEGLCSGLHVIRTARDLCSMGGPESDIASPPLQSNGT